MQNIIADYEFEAFSSRKSFNKNLKHFKSVNEVIASFESGVNIADVIHELIENSLIEVSQISPILNALLVEKYEYEYVSHNLRNTNSDLEALGKEFLSWNAVDLVLAYHHPESGLVVVNPKNEAHWQTIGELRRNEFVILYAGGQAKTSELRKEKIFSSLLKTALERSVKVLNGEKGKTPANLLNGKFTFKKVKKVEPKAVVTPAKAKAVKTKAVSSKTVVQTVALVDVPAAVSAPSAARPVAVAAPAPVRQVATASGRMTVSPKIPIQVTNELFHNGNVEAWKRIIESYTVKYAPNRVTIYYDGEIIHDINSLFKWGKVKHGTAILFSVSSPEEKIADLSKLRKYLLEGASNRFEVFLKGAPGKTLELF